MREVKVSSVTEQKIDDLLDYLRDDLKMSDVAVGKYWLRMSAFLTSLQNDADYALCRFAKWQKMGWRCVPFGKDWIFAYEVFDEGVIIQDMGNASAMKK